MKFPENVIPTCINFGSFLCKWALLYIKKNKITDKILKIDFKRTLNNSEKLSTSQLLSFELLSKNNL
jgi:hypothetical protein